MNLLNKILILLIILFLINHLTSGKIFDTVKKYYNSCVEKFSTISEQKCIEENPQMKQIPYAGQQDFPYLDKSDKYNPDTYNLYKFINSCITPNQYEYQMTADRSEPHDVSSDMYKYILKSLTKIFNKSDYMFKNIKIVDRLYYFDNMNGKDIIPFNFTADIYYKSKPIGLVKIYIESFIYEQIKGGLYSIINVRLLDRNKPENKNIQKKHKKPQIDYNIEQTNDIFINDTEDIVIPSINLTELEYELPSENCTSDQ